MKICMLTQDFPPTVGGIAAHVYELSKALVKQGNDVYVIAPRFSLQERKYEEVDGIKVYRVLRLCKIGHTITIKKLILTSLYIPPAIWKLKSIIKDIDIVHCHNTFLEPIITKFIETPKVLTEHESGFLFLAENKRNEKLLRWLLNHYDWIIGPSKELVDTCIRFGVSENKTSFMSNGVDPEKFNPKIKGDEIREKYQINPNDKIILCPRRLEPKNGVRYLIKAMPYIIEDNSCIKCLIVGDGSEMDTLTNEISKLKINDKVIFAGNITNSEMPKYYAASDIVVLPSLKEATSIAGLEAMATGKPLVGTNVGGIPQLIADGETGILVPPKNPEALAHAIVSLSIDDEKRIEMGSNARRKIEKELSWDVIAKKVINIYKDVIDIY